MLLNTPAGKGTVLDIARFSLNSGRGAVWSLVKMEILSSIEAAYRAAASKNCCQGNNNKKKPATVSKKSNRSGALE
ncbi:hypothetical protein HZA73_04845 [candidate division TA06 bacterium]|nr:hypothetical protein [candidate division TA06 bacterium]